MASGDRRRPEELFHAALARPDRERDRFLFGACRGDWDLYAEVRGLLAHHVADDASEEPRPSTPEPADLFVENGDSGIIETTLGRYEILQVIGEGGMGIVYLANQTRPVFRRVALKVLKLGLGSQEARVRFDAERQALALMNHPHIAHVFEAGSTPDGRLYFAMEYVPGLPITEFCSRARLGLRARLELFRKVCLAVHHAHQKGIIHRDLKPSNVMVTDQEGEPIPKIIDFGVAKTTERLAQNSPNTPPGLLVGSFDYMSPEQIASAVPDVDIRADIYSLGVLLYELVTGAHPLDMGTAQALGLPEIERRIREVEPALPSRRIAASENRAWLKAVRGDLDWVTSKALEKNRLRRYASASEFAADIQHYLDREPVQAGSPGRIYLLRKFVQRHRNLVTGVAAVAAALILGLFVSTTLYLENREAMRMAQTQRNDILRLSDVNRLATCLAEARQLVPPHPDQIPHMEAWLNGPARALAERLPRHRSSLRALSVEFENRVAAGTDAGQSDPTQGGAATTDPEVLFQYDILARLVADLEVFVDPDPRVGAIADVQARLDYAREVEQRSLELAAASWQTAVASIADSNECPWYSGLRIAPQMGLVPIGQDPESGLWEFAHLQSGEPPRRDTNGRLVLTEDASLVLVLVPGGGFWMGAELPPSRAGTANPNVDTIVRSDESPVHYVILDPFFVSKYEMTQAQWIRVRRANPSRGNPSVTWGERRHTLLHPVEDVSWSDADWTARLMGLALPTEAQWEYMARAGTTGPWCGWNREDLAGFANLVDQYARRHGKPPGWPFEAWNDGYADTSPVGHYRPNRFGLHDVIGNIFEWCRDFYGSYTLPTAPGDGFRTVDGATDRVIRSGDFSHIAVGARVSRRAYMIPETRAKIGLRPVSPVRSAADH